MFQFILSFFRKPKRGFTADMCTQEHIAHFANVFQENYSNAGNFDFSVRSLEDIDAWIEEMSTYAKISKSALENARMAAGCYILEVARVNYGGDYQWWEDRNVPVLTYSLSDNEIYIAPFDRVEARI